jgi:hypothetical protein
LSPAPAAPSPPPPGASAPRASAAARATREPVHTRQPLPGAEEPSAPRRPTPRRARKSRAEPQAHPGTRRTFHERADHQEPTRSAREVCSTRLGATSHLAPGTLSCHSIEKSASGWRPRATSGTTCLRHNAVMAPCKQVGLPATCEEPGMIPGTQECPTDVLVPFGLELDETTPSESEGAV